MIIVVTLVIFMLVTISYTTAVSTNKTDIERKESPLYGIRVKLAVGDKINDVIRNIKVRFLGERVFFIPREWLNLGDFSERLSTNFKGDDTCSWPYTCSPNPNCYSCWCTGSNPGDCPTVEGASFRTCCTLPRCKS